ncbi:Pentatricopeptide repeat-containing protein At2g36240 [Linum perenne]
MARSLASTNRISELTSLLQFIASNPCPCSEGIFCCPRIEPIFHLAVNAYCKAGSLDSGFAAFESMRKLIDGKPSVAIYNGLINGFVKSGNHAKGLEVYNIMLKDRVKPDVFTFNILINSYCKNKKFEMALELFREMKEKGCTPNVVSFNTLIRGFFRQGKIDDAVKMAHEMIDLGIEFSGVTCEILLDGLCKQGRNVEKKGVVPSEFDLSTLVDSLCKRGFAGRALEVVYELWRNGKAPSLICSTTLVEGVRRSGMTEDAFRLMEKLLKETTIVPDLITFNCLIRDVCKTGRTSDANELMLLGCSKGLEPDWKTYDVLVSGYTAEGKRKEGEGLVDEMLDRDFIPDLATYNTLMNGLSRSRGSVQKRT